MFFLILRRKKKTRAAKDFHSSPCTVKRNVIQSQGQRGPRGLSRLHAALVLIRRAMRRNNWPLI